MAHPIGTVGNCHGLFLLSAGAAAASVGLRDAGLHCPMM